MATNAYSAGVDVNVPRADAADIGVPLAKGWSALRRVARAYWASVQRAPSADEREFFSEV